MAYGFFDTTRVLRDTVTIYDAPTADSWAGGIVGGSSVVASAVPGLVAPLSQRESLQVLGLFPDTVARLYVGTAVTVFQHSRVEINRAAHFGTGVMFVVQGDPQLYMLPFTPGALYQTAWLAKVQR